MTKEKTLKQAEEARADNRKKQQRLIKRRREAGLKEIRGVWAPVEQHKEIKRVVRALIK